MQEIIKELRAQKNMREIDSEQVLIWAQRVEIQRVQKKALDEINNVKDFNHINRGKRTKIDNKQQPREQSKKLKTDNCKYCGAAHS